MNPKIVFELLHSVIEELKANAQWGTAHVYQSTYNILSLYRGNTDLKFREMTPTLIKDFEIFLRHRKCTWNTVSTYMKVLKAIYNRAVDYGLAPFVPRLFGHVHTHVDSRRKRALEAGEMGDLLFSDKNNLDVNKILPDKLVYVRAVFSLMFMLRGMAFVDIAFLRKTDIQGNLLIYRRRKTRKLITVRLTKDARDIISQVMDKYPESPYLFPFISSPEGSEEAYREYQLALRSFNHRLKALSDMLAGKIHLSSYTARHTWATMAYYCEIHQGIISEAMGHSSITVTETYLKPFKEERIDRANRKVISYVKKKAHAVTHGAESDS